MSFKCDYCQKGVGRGHMVSHAKNRLVRLFKPNLQKLKVARNGIALKVKFCTRCIKRLKLDGRIGNYTWKKYVKPEVVPEKTVVTPKTQKPAKPEKVEAKIPKKTEKEGKKEKQVKSEKPEKPAKILDIASIVGKKS